MEGSVACKRAFHLSRSRPWPAARHHLQRRASFGLNRYAIFSCWLSSSLFSFLLFSSPLFVTSFWLIKSFRLSLTSQHSFTLKNFTSNLQKKMKKYSIYFLSSKTLTILDKNFLRRTFYTASYTLYYTLNWLKARRYANSLSRSSCELRFGDFCGKMFLW